MPPYQCELCRVLDCVCDLPDLVARLISSANQNQEPTWSGVTAEGNGLCTELEAMIQNLVDTQNAAAHIHSPSIRSGLLHTPDSVHRTGDHAVVVLHIPSADEYHVPGERLVDVNEMPSHPIAISVEHVGRETQTTEAQLASPPSTTRASCPTALCRWRDEDTANICGDAISCNDVPAHFKYVHAIENINEYLLVDCRWEMCFTKVVRKNFARHIRECHLLHVRKKGHVVPQTDGV